MSSIRSASWVEESIRILAAASSMASGRPSSRWQMVSTAAAFSSVTRNDGRTSCARCSNSLTASELASADAVGAGPPSGSDSGGTCQLSSPSTPRASRLVASTTRAGQAASRYSARLAAASARCSQLSSTTSTGWSATCLAIASTGSCPGVSGTPSWVATAWPTMAGSSIWASATQQAPAGKDASAVLAAASASRVFPVPPGPVRVISRLRRRACTMSSSSLSRPTSGVSRTGSCPLVSDIVLPSRSSTGNALHYKYLAPAGVCHARGACLVHHDSPAVRMGT